MGEGFKTEKSTQSKKLVYYSICFLSKQCASHYKFKKIINECTIKKEDGCPLANKDFIYLISLKKMVKISIIQLRELTKLFLDKNIKKI